MPYTQAQLSAALDAANGAITHAQLHDGDPGSGGTSNVLSQSSRTAFTLPTAVDGVAQNNAVFTITGATSPITHITFWNQPSGGTLQATASLDPEESFTGAGTLTVAVSTGISDLIINALALPSAFGWPDATNTGPSGDLTPSGTIFTSNHGQVIEDLDIYDTTETVGIWITHNNVTVRNCRIRVANPSSSGGGIIQNIGTGLLVEDCEIFYDTPGQYGKVIGDSNYTMRRCYIHNFSEGPRVGENTLVEDCYIVLPLVDDEVAHADGMQSTGGDNITIRHNTIDVSENIGADLANAAIIIGTEGASSDGILIENNLFNGGGYVMYMGATSPNAMENVTVKDNRFGRDSEFGTYSIDAGSISNLTWTNNVYDDDNSEVPTPT